MNLNLFFFSARQNNKKETKVASWSPCDIPCDTYIRLCLCIHFILLNRCLKSCWWKISLIHPSTCFCARSEGKIWFTLREAWVLCVSMDVCRELCWWFQSRTCVPLKKNILFVFFLVFCFFFVFDVSTVSADIPCGALETGFFSRIAS